MRRFNVDTKIGFNLDGLTFQNIVVREVTPVDEFYFEHTRSSDDGKDCVSFTDPIRMLFNQQRLNTLGTTAIQAWLDSLQQRKNDPLAELRAKCSDADLIAMIKSRHIQQPCEILAYAEECKNNMDMFNAEVKKLMEQRQQEELAKATSQSQSQEPL